MLPTLLTECSDFLLLSEAEPLLKNIPKHSDGFRKVKIRKRKNLKNNFIESFNDTFKEHEDLFQRAMFASKIMEPINDDTLEPFYVFPINGFKFMYSDAVKNTTESYKIIFDKLMENLNGNQNMELFSEVLRFNYKFDNLSYGIKNGAEIIIYGIPYYYAIRKTLIDDYKSFIYDK